MIQGAVRPANDVSVDEAISLILASAMATSTKRVKLEKASGRILAEPIVALRDQPPFEASAMDGYAISDLAETLVVAGESQAGRAYCGKAKSGQAVRIYTGAPVPAGTTRVILQEHVSRDGDTITLGASTGVGKTHIRPRGTDFRRGEVLLHKGERLDSGRLSLAAAAGFAQVLVARKPSVTLICTGDELVRPGAAPRHDQVYESSSYALMALVRAWGGKAANVHVADDSDALVAAIDGARSDILVTVGGASVGDYDLVKPALAELGMVWDFDKVNLRPGRPAAFGRLNDGRRVLNLPGNPTSALVCAHLFLKPLIRRILGQLPETLRSVACGTALPANGPRETWLRGRLSAEDGCLPVVMPLDDQDSSLIGVFAKADVLIRRTANAEVVLSGDIVPIQILHS